MLYFIGISLASENLNNLSLDALSKIKKCRNAFLFASKFHSYDRNLLENSLEKPLKLITDIELAEFIKSYDGTVEENTCLLMPGNPFCDDLYPVIKYHCDIESIQFEIVHSTCYRNELGNAGIQLYKFGETAFVYSDEKESIENVLEILRSNHKNQLNTMILINKDDKKNLSNICLKEINDMKCDENFHPRNKIVVLYKMENLSCLQFDYGSCDDLLPLSLKYEIECMCVCYEFDCVEEEYLTKMKKYQSGKINQLNLPSANRTLETSGAKRTLETSGAKQTFETSGAEQTFETSGSKENLERTILKETFGVIGLGLGKAEDITVKGKSFIDSSDNLFLEGYTSIMLDGKDKLESFYNKKITVADRLMVEQNSEEILGYLEKSNVSFLVVGDPLGATTHSDIILRCLDLNKDILIANNTSIINTVGVVGLKPSKFGGIVSIPFWTETYKPDSFYDKIDANLNRGLHTLCLLDIQVKEISFENLARGKQIFEKPRYMDCSIACKQILESRNIRLKTFRTNLETGDDKTCSMSSQSLLPNLPITEATKCIGLSRIGTDTENIKIGTLGQFIDLDLGPPLHSLIVVGQLDEDEQRTIKI